MIEGTSGSAAKHGFDVYFKKCELLGCEGAPGLRQAWELVMAIYVGDSPERETDGVPELSRSG